MPLVPARRFAMTTKAMIHAEIETVPDENLDELYDLVRGFVAAKQPAPKPGILSQLREIQIDAPVDFAANLDQYTRGEKDVATNLP
jgi:hypothetical protein